MIATGNYPSDNSTLANFQSWSSAIYAAFIAFGWELTSDSGQAAYPQSALPNSWSYWIFKAADTLAAALPIYVKMEFGNGSGSPQIRVSVGTGSDGNGNINGVTCSGLPWPITLYNANCGNSVFPCFFSGDAGNFRMYMWQSATINSATLFGIERSKNSSGADTADYFTVLCCNSSSAYYAYQQTILPTIAGNRDTGILGLGVTNGSNSGYFNGSVASFPVFPIFGKCGNPMLGFQTCCALDVIDGSTVTVASLYGSTHTFIAASQGYIQQICGYRGSSATNMALLMRYE